MTEHVTPFDDNPIHEPHCNTECRPDRHYLSNGVGMVHLHRTDLAACGACIRKDRPVTDRLQEIRDRHFTDYIEVALAPKAAYETIGLLRKEIDRLQADNDRLSLAYHELIVRNAIKDTPAD